MSDAVELQTMMRTGVARTGEQIGFEVYGFGEDDGDGYPMSVLFGISLAVLAAAVRLALAGEPLAAGVLVLVVVGLYAAIAARQGLPADGDIDADRALVVTSGRVLIGDTANQPADRAIGAMPRGAVTHAMVEVADRAVGPQQGASRVSLHGPSGEIAALVTPGVTVNEVAKRFESSAPVVASSTTSAGPLWLLGAVGIFVAVIVAVFGAVMILGGDGVGILVGVLMVFVAGAVGFGCAGVMRKANARAKERGESVRVAVDLRSTPTTPISIETSRDGLTPMRFAVTVAVGVLLVVMAAINSSGSDERGTVAAPAQEPVVVADEPLTEPTPTTPAPSIAAPADCTDGSTSAHWGGVQQVGSLVLGAGYCSLTVVADGAVRVAELPCTAPHLVGRNRPAAAMPIVPVWCDGDVLGVDVETLETVWRWAPDTATTTQFATEFGGGHLAVQTVDGIDVIDLASGTTVWFDTLLEGAAFGGSEDVLYVSQNEVTTARRWSDGSVVWEAPIGLRWIVAQDDRLFGFRNRDVVRLDPADGTVLAASSQDRHFLGGFIRAGRGDQVASIDQAGTTIVVLDADTLTPVVTLDGLGLSLPVVDDGLLARYDYGAESIVVHDAVTGAELGRWAALPGVPVLQGRVLYSATSDGSTVTMHATPIG